MTALEKAELQVLDKKGKATETIAVQFNPMTMSLQMANSIDGGQSRARQTQQYNGTSSTTLSLDLEFDTADEGTSADPVDVRSRTMQVAQFVLPGGEESKQAPPRLNFRWGTFELKGVMSSLSEELSFFSSDGVPLRAKLSVQIKEQDPKFEALERGPGANDGGGAAAAGEGGADAGAPGTNGGGPVDRLASALDGETPADFLARNGLAPAAWRALGGALDALAEGIELEAGASIGFDSSLSIGGGLGVSAGFQAGLDVSVGARLGVEASTTATMTSSGAAARTQGRALAAAGGVTAASEQAKTIEASTATSEARASFGASSAPPAAAPSGGDRRPIASSAAATSASVGPAAPAALPPLADRRSTTFGRGVPLREQVTPPGSSRDGYVVVGRSTPIEVTARSGRTAPWERLTTSPTRHVTDREQHRRDASRGCHRCDPLAPTGGRR